MASMYLLDDRIRKDLEDLYKHQDMAGANSLWGTVEKNGVKKGFSPRLLPIHFTGNRDAKTVFIMLNPGYGISPKKGSNDKLEDLEWNDFKEKTKDYNLSNLDSFVECYKCRSKNYGNLDFERLDNFDLKQAAFIKSWHGCGVDISDYYLCHKDMRKVAKRNVLMQKLQLELVPYCSPTFDSFVASEIHKLFPYLETILEEIFRVERAYVIFASAKFEELFNEYNKSQSNIFDIPIKEESKRLTPKLSGKCKVIKIKYKGKKIKALIAHTFPHQALPNAYHLMEEYGKFCYDTFLTTK